MKDQICKCNIFFYKCIKVRGQIVIPSIGLPNFEALKNESTYIVHT